MWQSEVSIDIDAPVSEVYRYLADFPRHKEWAYARMAYLEQVTPGPIQVGSEFAAAETVPFRAVTHSRITALEPGSRVAWRAWFSKGSAFDWELVLSESDGGTHLVQRTVWHSALLFRALTWPLVVLRRRQMPVENRRSLERIKANLEEGVLASTSGGNS
ncbi:MAG TPA: SRPBCC family protein [Terriglobales bacterium]|nr:SRPBCC family protein [Terriglobales bacterium]